MKTMLLFVVLLHAGLAHAAPTVSVLPSANSVTVGQQFDVTIEVDAEFGAISCYAIELHYDDTLLSLVAATQGTLYSASLDPTFFQHSADPDGDDVFSDCVLGFGTTVTAPGELVRLTFQAIDDGQSPLHLESAVLRDVDRAVIPGVVLVDGTANVGLTATPPLLAGGRLVVTPNPSAGRSSFALRGADGARGALQLWIFDAKGRRVGRFDLAAERLASGGWAWDGRDETGRRVAAGGYFAQLRDGARVLQQAKFLRLN